MFDKRSSIRELYELSFREIKAAASTPVKPSEHYEKNADSLKKLCEYFEIEDGVGICKKLDGICHGWQCEYLEICAGDCVSKCLALDIGANIYTSTPPEISTAMKVLEKNIREIADSIPPEVVIKGLLKIAEESLIMALTWSPLEIFTSIRLRKWMFKTYGEYNSINISDDMSGSFDQQIALIWRNFLALLDFEREWSKVDNGDSIVIMSPDGDKVLKSIVENPIGFIEEAEESIKQIELTKKPPDISYLRCAYWTRKMVPVFLWSMSNQMPIDLHDSSLLDPRRAVYDHMVEVGKRKTLNPRECLRLGLPLYTALFHTLRYAALSDPFFAQVISEYKGMITEKDCGVSLSPFFWDHTIINLNYAEKYKSLIIPSLNLQDKQSKLWPIDDGYHALRGSSIIMAFSSQNYDDIIADNEKLGFYFEDIISKELEDRRIPIIGRNIPIPDGEIDAICFDSIFYYIVEAKDYGPRGRQGYFSSEEYNSRNEELVSYLKKFEKRIKWIKDNKSAVEIPENAQIVGIYLTSFEEPHVIPPEDILVLNHRRLCGLFGGPPVDPLLKLEAMKAKPETVETKVISKPRTKESKGDFKGSKLPRKVSRFAMRRIQSLFGDVTTFQLYRVAWEICSAFSSKAFCVMELSAEPNGRPASPTKQYLTFVAHRSDAIPLSDIENSYNKLVQKGFIKENGSSISLGKSVDTEYWQHSTGKWKRVTIEKEAELILFQQIISHTEELGKMAMFIDGLYGHPRVLLMFKEISD